MLSRAKPEPLVPVAGLLPLARNLRTASGFRRLLLQDRLLSEIDEELPFARHVPGTFQQFDFVEWSFTAGDPMGAKEIIVSHPEGYTVTGAIFGAISASDTVGFLKCAVQPFDELFERTELFGHLIAIGQTDDLGDGDIPAFFQLELLGSQWIGAVAVGNEPEGFAGEFFKFIKSHAHGKDTGTDIPGRGELITEDGAGYFIHDEPEVGFPSPDLDIGFISGEFVGGLVIIGIHEGADEDCRRLGIVIDHGMGDLDPMDFFQSLYSLAQGEFEVYPVRKAQPHDIGIVFPVFERGRPFWEMVYVHVKEVDGELPVKIAELVFPVLRRRKILGKFFPITLIVRAVVIDTFMDPEVLAVFDRLECMAAVRTLELQRGNHLLTVDKGLAADLALKLSAAAGIVVDVLVWRTAERAYGIRGNRTGLVFVRLDRFYGLAITETVILVPEKPVLFDKRFDNGKFIRKEFLVFWAVDLIVSPLFERDISADKKNKPANLVILFLNDVK